MIALAVGLALLPGVVALEARLPGFGQGLLPLPSAWVEGITTLGLGWIDIGFFILLFLVARGRSRSASRVGLVGAIGVSAAGLLGQLVKLSTCRARPSAAAAGRFLSEFPCLLAGYHTASFPSGHATTAFAAATFLALWRPGWSLPAFAAACLVAASRVELGAHFPSDVLAGALLGTAVALGCWTWAERRGLLPGNMHHEGHEGGKA
jgi:undecaprenyl-diphosphatase